LVKILKNKFEALAIANSRIYFLKYYQKYPSLRALHIFYYASSSPFELAQLVLQGSSLPSKKYAKAMKILIFRDALKIKLMI